MLRGIIIVTGNDVCVSKKTIKKYIKEEKDIFKDPTYIEEPASLVYKMVRDGDDLQNLLYHSLKFFLILSNSVS